MRIASVQGSFVQKNFLQNRKNASYLPKQNHGADIFIRSQKISFKGGYERSSAENLITKIENSQAQEAGRGFQGAYYKLSGEIGIKAPKPFFPEQPEADLNGQKNIKEYFALKKINEIDPQIAPKAYDLIERNGKNYLVIENIQGAHPGSTKLGKEALSDLFQKIFTLDTNGIYHSDLQSANIFITPKDKAKIIDFGSFSLTLNDGRYIESDAEIANSFKTGSKLTNDTNSPAKGKFLASFYRQNHLGNDFKNFSDNPDIPHKSNASNFEFRTIYDYLASGKEENPVEFMREYLKIKAKNYHEPMLGFLESLQVNPQDNMPATRMQKAIENEKIFIEIFSNPSDEVIKAELEKIQMKWLLNDYQGANKKAYSYKETINKHLSDLLKTSKGAQKKYFELMTENSTNYQAYMYYSNYENFKGETLKDEDDLVKKLFDPPKPKTEAEIQQNAQNLQSKLEKSTKSGKKLFWIGGIVLAAAVSGGIYLYNKKHNPQTAQK